MRVPRRRSLAVVVVLSLLGGRGADAQARYDLWSSIDRRIGELGEGQVASARPEQRLRLANDLLERGLFYIDLYEFERVLVRDHARMRDSIGKAGGIASPAAAYLLGRAYHELGREREAASAYSAVPASAPAPARSGAAAWSATLKGGGPRSWQQDLVDWRGGRPVKPGACPPASPACDLLRAIVASNVPQLLRLTRELARERPADVTDGLAGPDKRSAIEYIDPLTSYLLAMADFTLVDLLLRDVPRTEPQRGIALLRLRRFDAATPLLQRAAEGAGSNGGQLWALVGEALAGAGKRSDAESAWRKAPDGAAANVAADARVAVLGDGAFAERRLAAERARGLSRLRDGAEGGIYLARALLRAGKAADANATMSEVRPLSLGSSLNTVRSYVLVLAAHAEYLEGALPGMRGVYAAARGDLAAVANSVGSARPALALLQQLTALTDSPAENR